MTMTIVEMVTEAADLIRVSDTPTTITGAGETTRIFRAAANYIGRHLVKQHEWGPLWEEDPITLESGDDTYSIAAEADRLIANTGFDQTQYRQLRGARTAREWRILKNNLVAANNWNRSYRVAALVLTADVLVVQVHPEPTASGDELIIEYISKNFCQNGSTHKSAWSEDDDLPRLDENLFILGIAYRVKQTLGLPYFDERSDFENALGTEIAGDINIGSVAMSSLAGNRHPGDIVPDGNFTL